MALTKEQKTKYGFAVMGVLFLMFCVWFWGVVSTDYSPTPEQAAVGCARARAMSQDGNVAVLSNTEATPLPSGQYAVRVTTEKGTRVCTVTVKDAAKSFCDTRCD